MIQKLGRALRPFSKDSRRSTGSKVAIFASIYRFATAGDAARIQSYVAELVSSAPDLIVASGTPVIAALKQATATIPIVFASSMILSVRALSRA